MCLKSLTLGLYGQFNHQALGSSIFWICWRYWRWCYFPNGNSTIWRIYREHFWFPGGAKTKSRLFVELNPCLASNVKQKCCRWMMFLANERCSMWYQRAQCSCTPIKLPFFGRELHFDVYTWPKPRIWRNMGGIYPHFLIYLFLLLLCVCSFFGWLTSEGWLGVVAHFLKLQGARDPCFIALWILKRHRICADLGLQWWISVDCVTIGYSTR